MEVIRKFSGRRASPASQFSLNDPGMIEATRGMSGDEVAAFHEKMQKMNKFLEDELVELEEQKTKLMMITNSGDIGTFDEERRSLKGGKRKSTISKKSSDEIEEKVKKLEDIITRKSIDLESLRHELDGVSMVREQQRQRLELYEVSLSDTEKNLASVSIQLKDSLKELSEKTTKILQLETKISDLLTERKKGENGTLDKNGVKLQEAKIKELERLNANLQQNIVMLENELKTKDEALQKNENDILLYKNQIKSLEDFQQVFEANERRRRDSVSSHVVMEYEKIREIEKQESEKVIEKEKLKHEREREKEKEKKEEKEKEKDLEKEKGKEKRKGKEEKEEKEVKEEKEEKEKKSKEKKEKTKKQLSEEEQQELDDLKKQLKEKTQKGKEKPHIKANEKDIDSTIDSLLTSLSPKSSTEALQLQPTIKNVKPILKNENSPKKGLPVRFALKTLLLDSSLEGDLEQVQKCVENGADINCANEEGLTALHSSSCNGHFEIVKYLVEHGANVNSVDDDLWTPLHGAACFGELAVVEYLVSSGGNTMAVNADGDTPYSVTIQDLTKKYLLDSMRRLKNSTELYSLYDYDAQQEDELSFVKGEKFTIIMSPQDRENDLWWLATNSKNKSGYIPSNYLSEFNPSSVRI